MSFGHTAPATCDPAARVTRSLLGYGVIAGPFFVVVSLAQALTRDGFDLTRHAWSLLANGPYGWIQTTNFVLTGLMVAAAAGGLHRRLAGGRGATWAPRLLAAFGVGTVAAGIFRADPALGFPAGTPADTTTVTWHGMLHLVTSGVGFICLVAACLMLARRFTADGRRGWAAYSRATGALFLAGFAAVASGGGATWANLTFTAAVILAWAWLTAVSLHLYHHTSR